MQLGADHFQNPLAYFSRMREEGPVPPPCCRTASGSGWSPGTRRCGRCSPTRGPGRFDDADRLDVGRDAGGHVTFGHGIHYCLGAPLARLEGEVAFGALLSRFPGLSLAADLATRRWRPSSLILGLETLRSASAERARRNAVQ